MESNHYRNAPITEALIDLRVDEVPSHFLYGLQELHQIIADDYPNKEDMHQLLQQVKAGSSVTTTTTQTHIGYRFISADKKQIFQARLDGFTFSRLAPYENWKAFRDEAKRLWNAYQSVVQDVYITRVAVRYINRLDLPLPLQDFRDYLRTVPEVSSDLPQNLSDYFMQLQIPQEDLKAMLVINEALVPPVQENVLSVVLDLDLFINIKLESHGEQHWQILEDLRVRKNEAFEACITDNTRRLLR